MATAQEIQAWLSANPGATDRDIAAAMNQYGVSASDLSGATGWDQGAITDRYGVANAQNYIGTQLSGDGSIPGWGSAFTPDGTFDYSNSQRNNMALGALSGMGLTADQQARALGLPSDAIQAYAQQNAPSVDIYKSIYQTDLTNPAPYMQPVNSMTNPASTLGLPQAAPSQAAPAPLPPQAPAGGISPSFGPVYGQMDQGTGGGPITGPNPYLGAAQGSGFTQNPYYTQMADDIMRRTQQGLGDAFNQIRSNSVATGGLGGSRQGVAQGIATGRAMDSMQGQLGGLFGGLYESGQNRDLTNQGQMLNFYGSERRTDLDAARTGADLYRIGLAGEWSPVQNAASIYGPFSGMGGSQTDSSSRGGGLLGALGGAGAGYQWYRGLQQPSNTQPASTGWGSWGW